MTSASNQAVEDDSVVLFQFFSIDDKKKVQTSRHLFERKGKAHLATDNGKEVTGP